jgi:putative phosphoesterase
MSTRIGLISDVHATPSPVAEALSIFEEHAVEQVYCLGDIAGYGNELAATVNLLQQSDTQAILGNHDQWFLEQHAGSTLAGFFEALPTHIEMTIEGISLYMVHASPPDSLMDGIRLLDQEGKPVLVQQLAWAGELDGFQYDVLIVGHTHQVFTECIANTRVVNPGSTVFNHSCAILTLPECNVEWLALSGNEIKRTWNWSGGMPEMA